ncbi:MAG TPA: ribonuclease J, partial [Aggregatilineales bacterium]|nr:ribonuclease J [Aggregatilineales bacterium]
AGIMFPENDMLGIDYIIPDFSYLVNNKNLRFRGIIITHGHEDHTGAIQHVMASLTAPVYATPLTRGLLEVKLKQAKLLDRVQMITFKAGDTLSLGPFKVETFHVCHSIPDGVGLGITTPVGLIVHSGDFKFDHTPVDNWPPDFAKLAEFSTRGVLALMADSTNADRPGWTPSERVIDDAFDKVFRDAPGRIMIATFASLISHIQQVATAAQRYNRKLAVAGHTMSENIRMAMNLGYLELPSDLLIGLEDVRRYNPREVAIVMTGTQGEPSAALSRLAAGRHNQLQIIPGDTVIMSSHPIPGNEELVHRNINRLFQKGANVIYDPIAQVHVSGHASQEEQKLLINLIRPKYFIPVHGELRHLHQHARLAEAVGIPPENIAVVENGTMISFDQAGKMTIGERLPGGYIFVDGAGVGTVGPQVMRDREVLARDGVVVVNVVVNRDTMEVIGEPTIVSRGFVSAQDSSDLMDSARQTVKRVVNQNIYANGRKQELVLDALNKLFYNETKRHPVIFTFINPV